MGSDAPLITLSGPPASGTTTLSERLAAEFGFDVLNGGDIFRDLAAERGLSVSEFAALAEDDPQIDRDVDERLRSSIDAHLEGARGSKPGSESTSSAGPQFSEAGLVVESRLAGWHADGRADLSVWLDAPAAVRANRLDDRNETSTELRAREQSDAARYRDYYDIDISDLSVYDLVVDTATLSERGTVQTVTAAIRDRLQSRQPDDSVEVWEY